MAINRPTRMVVNANRRLTGCVALNGIARLLTINATRWNDRSHPIVRFLLLRFGLFLRFPGALRALFIVYRRLYSNSRADRLPNLLFFRSKGNFLCSYRDRPFNFQQALYPVLYRFPASPFRFYPPTHRIIIRLLRDATYRVRFFRFRSNRFPRVLAKGLKVASGGDFRSNTFFLPRLLQYLCNVTSEGRKDIRHIPLSQGSFQAQPIKCHL